MDQQPDKLAQHRWMNIPADLIPSLLSILVSIMNNMFIFILVEKLDVYIYKILFWFISNQLSH